MSRAGEHALLMSVVTTGIIKKSSRAPFLCFMLMVLRESKLVKQRNLCSKDNSALEDFNRAIARVDIACLSFACLHFNEGQLCRDS